MFPDSALKVVFTTLYVDIKEPAAGLGFGPQKKLNLFSGDHLSRRGGIHHFRDKIEFQFAVPNSGQNHSRVLRLGSPASGGVRKVTRQNRPSTVETQFFVGKCAFFPCPVSLPPN